MLTWMQNKGKNSSQSCYGLTALLEEVAPYISEGPESTSETAVRRLLSVWTVISNSVVQEKSSRLTVCWHDSLTYWTSVYSWFICALAENWILSLEHCITFEFVLLNCTNLGHFPKRNLNPESWRTLKQDLKRINEMREKKEAARNRNVRGESVNSTQKTADAEVH